MIHPQQESFPNVVVRASAGTGKTYLAVASAIAALTAGYEQPADYYVDLRRVTLDGDAAPLVGAAMLDAWPSHTLRWRS